MNKFLKLSSFLALFAGAILILGGAWGIAFTYQNVTAEKITTPADASIPNTPVRGPFTLKSQADIIRKHTLNSTGGKTFAEMDRQDPKREMWVTATTLTTALNLAIFSYVFSGLIMLLGLISVWTGLAYRNIRTS